MYDGLTPNQVKEDPYVIGIYQKIKPFLPSNVTKLSINDIKKGSFVNGTVSYLIYFGVSKRNTHSITIVYDPNGYQFLVLQISQVIVFSLD